MPEIRPLGLPLRRPARPDDHPAAREHGVPLSLRLLHRLGQRPTGRCPRAARGRSALRRAGACPARSSCSTTPTSPWGSSACFGVLEALPPGGRPPYIMESSLTVLREDAAPAARGHQLRLRGAGHRVVDGLLRQGRRGAPRRGREGGPRRRALPASSPSTCPTCRPTSSSAGRRRRRRAGRPDPPLHGPGALRVAGHQHPACRSAERPLHERLAAEGRILRAMPFSFYYSSPIS